MTQHGPCLPAFHYRSSFIGPQIQSHAANKQLSALKRQSLTLYFSERHSLFDYFAFQRAEQLLRYKYNRSTSLGMISKHQLSIYLLSSPLYNHTAPLLFLFLLPANFKHLKPLLTSTIHYCEAVTSEVREEFIRSSYTPRI
jgi:hypothetical protein